MSTRFAFKSIMALANTLPRPIQYALSNRVSDLYYLFDKKAREGVRANLRVILGENAPTEQIRRESRRAFHSFGMYLAEFLGYRKTGGEFVEKNVIVEGREHLDEALARGRGALMCTAHFSNWELGGTIVAHYKYPITIIVQMHGNPKINELFVSQREARGIEIVHSQHGARAALKAFRANRAVAIAADRTTGGPVIPVTLFGRRTFLPQGPWRMAVSSGTALLPSFVYRRSKGNYTLEFKPPLQAAESLSRADQMRELAQKWAAYFEARVRSDPAQWAAFFRVWDDPATGERGHGDSLAAEKQWLGSEMDDKKAADEVNTAVPSPLEREGRREQGSSERGVRGKVLATSSEHS